VWLRQDSNRLARFDALEIKGLTGLYPETWIDRVVAPRIDDLARLAVDHDRVALCNRNPLFVYVYAYHSDRDVLSNNQRSGRTRVVGIDDRSRARDDADALRHQVVAVEPCFPILRRDDGEVVR